RLRPVRGIGVPGGQVRGDPAARSQRRLLVALRYTDHRSHVIRLVPNLNLYDPVPLPFVGLEGIADAEDVDASHGSTPQLLVIRFRISCRWLHHSTRDHLP